MQQKKLVQALISIGLVGFLAACGGGGGGGGASTGAVAASGTTTPTTGTMNMAVTDGPSENYNHVWVTITGIALHTDPNAVWSNSDATWQTTQITPTTIDLAQLNNGALNNLFNGLTLPAGTYKQIRFFFLGDEDPLSNSAQSTNNFQSPAIPLQWNDQVEYVNALGQIAEAPLEIANPVQGVRLDGNFVVTAGSTINLATDFDLDKIVVPFHHGHTNSFTMRPNLAYFNLNTSGAVTGQVDTTGLCPTNAQGFLTSTPASNCAFNLIVHAEAKSADGTKYQDVRSTRVNPLTGSFTIAPLPITDVDGNAISYDFVIRGRQMQTLVVTGVQPSGTYVFANGAESYTGGTSLGTLPITTVSEYPTNFFAPLSPLTEGYAVFEQTLPGGLPHEIRWADTNPFTGTIDRSFMASWNQGFYVTDDNLSVAPYSASGLTFGSQTPAEGTGNYSVIANEHVYYNFGVATPLLSNLSATTTSPALFTLGGTSQPGLATNVVSGTVSGNIDGTLNPKSNGATVESAYIVLARDAAIISTASVSAVNSTCFAGTTLTNCAYSFTGVGAGSTTTPLPGAYYYLYVRVFYSDGSHKTVPAQSYADLRQSNSATNMNVTVAL